MTGPDRSGGELVQSLTYRQAYVPGGVYSPPARALMDDAPSALRSAAGTAWALVSIVAAGSVLLLLVLVVVRLAGVLA